MTIKFIDFTYYWVKSKYKAWGEKDIPGWYAIMFLSLASLLYLMSIEDVLLYYGIITKTILDVPKIMFVLGLCISGLSVYVFSYKKLHLNDENAQLSRLPLSAKLFSIAFMFGSVALFIATWQLWN